MRKQHMLLWLVVWSVACSASPASPRLTPGSDAVDGAEGSDREVVPDVRAPAEPAVKTDSARRAEQCKPLLLRGATVLTAAGGVVEDAWLLVREGRIAALSSQRVEAGDARVVDVAGRFITPGLIDAHSHLGVYALPSAAAHDDGNENTSSVTAQVRAVDAFFPQDPGIRRALANGVTTALIVPGSTNLIGGEGAVFKLVPSTDPRRMLLPGAPRTVKMACGENPKHYSQGRMPTTRMGSIAATREAFEAAWRYREAWRRHDREYARYAARQQREGGLTPPPPPDRDFGMEVLVGVLDGTMLAQVHCYRADDMLNFLHLARTYGFVPRAFHHAVEAYKIRAELAESGVGVATWPDWWSFKLEAWDAVDESLGLLTRAGVRTAVKSDSPDTIRRLSTEAAKALTAARRAGLTVSDDEALRWITANPAWILGVEDRTGTLEEGKMADFVVWSRHPFSVYALVEEVYVDGVSVYRRAEDLPQSDIELQADGGAQ